MDGLTVTLFGRLQASWPSQPPIDSIQRKTQELLCYLLIHRDRPHPRETLAFALWEDALPARSKKQLRQALWKLQAILKPPNGSSPEPLLLMDPEWIQINPEAPYHLDVADFEEGHRLALQVPGRELDPPKAEALQHAAEIYQGDLLEGCYQDWCLYERERLKDIYLMTLDKLIDYSEAHAEYEAGLAYGTRALHYDRAREVTHRRLMRLHYLAGDRVAALRQYERCVSALEEELNVRPAQSTTALCEKIRADEQIDLIPNAFLPPVIFDLQNAPLPEVPGYLRKLRAVLTDIDHQIQRSIRAIERSLKE